jgi:CheY-like chemotaxis protein
MANIFVVENNKSIIDLLEEILVSGGHEVATAMGGLQASQIFKKRTFDLAFIDLGLPDIDGLTLIRELKNNNNPTIPVVISGRADLSSAVEAFRAGARDYILKPFDIEEILRIAADANPHPSQASSENIEKRSSKSGNLNSFSGAIFNQLIDPFIVAFTFVAGLLLQQFLLPFQEALSPIAIRKIIFLSISVGFCWAFISQYHKIASESDKYKIWKNYSWRLAGAYLLFGTILFFVYPLANCRPAMFGGYAVGLVALAVNRIFIVPRIDSLISARREGKRRIVIVGSGFQAEKMLANMRRQFGDTQVDRVSRQEIIEPLNKQNRKPLETQSELHLEAGSLNHEEINHLIRDFGGNRVVINIPEQNLEDEKQLARV